MFWDASAIVPLGFKEADTAGLLVLAKAETQFTVWWATPVECGGAAYRRRREGRCDAEALRAGVQRFRELMAAADFVLPTDALRHRAEHVIAAHPLRAADALQLAAALSWCDEQPWNESFVCLDKRLRDAARQEGFSVLPEEHAWSGRVRL
ncbi:MAG: hypothetical protein HY048_16910 [Acidobacteria bacterium]|nr:hypothetical protein [Acidobacteriota bacterium]